MSGFYSWGYHLYTVNNSGFDLTYHWGSGFASSKLFVGDGNDKIFGNISSDKVHTGGGNDLIRGGAGDDQLLGGDGDDAEIYAILQGYTDPLTMDDADGITFIEIV